MRKIRIIITLILTFSFLQVIWSPTFEAAAQSSLSNLTIISPQNKTYNSQPLTLNATIDFVFARIESMSYSIDGLGSYSFSNHFHSEDSTISHGTQIWLATLPELTEGPHFITAHLEGTLYFPDERNYNEQATVYFTIENTSSSHTPSPPTPSPSPKATLFPSPEPTISPEPTPTPPNMGPTSPPSQENLLTQEQTIILGLVVTVAVLAACLGLLVYLIRRK